MSAGFCEPPAKLLDHTVAKALGWSVTRMYITSTALCGVCWKGP